MKLFLDTSTLFKLYHSEADTAALEKKIQAIKFSTIYLSDVTKIEFSSTIWKKVRTKELTKPTAQITIDLFEIDFGNYNFVSVDRIILENARHLISKYGLQGLRTLDSIQLSTALSLIDQVDIFLTSDKLLNFFFLSESLPTNE